MTLADFFIKLKCGTWRPIRRKDSIQTSDKQELDLLLYQKPKAVNVFFKAYPMVPLSCRSNLAGQYL
jgi:hypothetical protein